MSNSFIIKVIQSDLPPFRLSNNEWIGYVKDIINGLGINAHMMMNKERGVLSIKFESQEDVNLFKLQGNIPEKKKWYLIGGEVVYRWYS